MTIKILSKKEEQDIHIGLTKKIKFNRMRLNKWIKDNPEHPDKFRIIRQKMERINDLEVLRNRFSVPYSYQN